MIILFALREKSACGDGCLLSVRESVETDGNPTPSKVRVTHELAGTTTYKDFQPRSAKWNQPEGPGWITPIYEWLEGLHP